jgi:hypothetical protein
LSTIAASLAGRPFPLTATVLLLASAAGCDSTAASSPPETARVRVERADPGEAVVVTSTSFTIAGSEADLIEADTQQVTPPFDMTFSLTEARRFFVSIGPTEGEVAELHMRVWIDERSWFDEVRELGVDPETLEFVYRYQGGS